MQCANLEKNYSVRRVNIIKTTEKEEGQQGSHLSDTVAQLDAAAEVDDMSNSALSNKMHSVPNQCKDLYSLQMKNASMKNYTIKEIFFDNKHTMSDIVLAAL